MVSTFCRLTFCTSYTYVLPEVAHVVHSYRDRRFRRVVTCRIVNITDTFRRMKHLKFQKKSTVISLTNVIHICCTFKKLIKYLCIPNTEYVVNYFIIKLQNAKILRSMIYCTSNYNNIMLIQILLIQYRN